MAKRFFRVQDKGIGFEDMCKWASQDGGSEEERHSGLAVCMSAQGLEGGSRFGGAWDALDPDDELIVLEGNVICQLYDGYCIEPTREVARFTLAQWEEMLADGRAYEYESW